VRVEKAVKKARKKKKGKMTGEGERQTSGSGGEGRQFTSGKKWVLQAS